MKVLYRHFIPNIRYVGEYKYIYTYESKILLLRNILASFARAAHHFTSTYTCCKLMLFFMCFNWIFERTDIFICLLKIFYLSLIAHNIEIWDLKIFFNLSWTRWIYHLSNAISFGCFALWMILPLMEDILNVWFSTKKTLILT